MRKRRKKNQAIVKPFALYTNAMKTCFLVECCSISGSKADHQIEPNLMK